jgi:hypothetical protein
LPQADNEGVGIQGQSSESLERIATQAFKVFGPDPRSWPDKVEINRNGTFDLNIVGTWRYEREREFVNVLFRNLERVVREDPATSPESSEGAV